MKIPDSARPDWLPAVFGIGCWALLALVVASSGLQWATFFPAAVVYVLLASMFQTMRRFHRLPARARQWLFIP